MRGFPKENDPAIQGGHSPRDLLICGLKVRFLRGSPLQQSLAINNLQSFSAATANRNLTAAREESSCSVDPVHAVNDAARAGTTRASLRTPGGWCPSRCAPDRR